MYVTATKSSFNKTLKAFSRASFIPVALSVWKFFLLGSRRISDHVSRSCLESSEISPRNSLLRVGLKGIPGIHQPQPPCVSRQGEHLARVATFATKNRDSINVNETLNLSPTPARPPSATWIPTSRPRPRRGAPTTSPDSPQCLSAVTSLPTLASAPSAADASSVPRYRLPSTTA